MPSAARVLVGLAVQLLSIAFAVYLVVSDAALPGASRAARLGLAGLSLAVGVLYGEVTRVRAHVAALISALQGRLASQVPRDDREAVDVLIAALDSKDAAVRGKAHAHLQRLTRQTLPADPASWRAWWRTAREGFGTRGGDATA